MMINKRLIGMVSNSKKHIAKNVLFQWISLIANIILIYTLSYIIFDVYRNKINFSHFLLRVGVIVCCICVKFVCNIIATKESYKAGESVKLVLREKIYKKLLTLGDAYKKSTKTAEVIQMATEGVEQLETYFGRYLPQFFYSLLAPITLFIVLSFINFKAAIILLICVPLIPVSIIVVQKIAKKLLSKYWSRYTELGDSFLENLQGLTTLKIYQADEFKHKQMNEQSEVFRKITMKVLTMQLNSVTLMDLITYGGAGLGAIIATLELLNGNINLAGCLIIIMLSADFFIPLRLLGSFFHIAMNGMAACDKIFNLLDFKNVEKTEHINFDDTSIKFKNVDFSYDGDRKILHDISLDINKGEFVSIVGESGSGKSTIASLIIGRSNINHGEAKIGNINIKDISNDSINSLITYVPHNSYLFNATVRENLLMGNKNATDDMLWDALDKVKLSDFINSIGGLSSIVSEKASNLSGGQIQRLAIARALLNDTPIYLFDEATSNIDSESENAIMNVIKSLSKSKTVILISHRLANVVSSDKIYVVDKGKIVESGNHDELHNNGKKYKMLWSSQHELEKYLKGEIVNA